MDSSLKTAGMTANIQADKLLLIFAFGNGATLQTCHFAGILFGAWH
jgi:hypothetical protein